VKPRARKLAKKNGEGQRKNIAAPKKENQKTGAKEKTCARATKTGGLPGNKKKKSGLLNVERKLTNFPGHFRRAEQTPFTKNSKDYKENYVRNPGGREMTVPKRSGRIERGKLRLWETGRKRGGRRLPLGGMAGEQTLIPGDDGSRDKCCKIRLFPSQRRPSRNGRSREGWENKKRRRSRMPAEQNGRASRVQGGEDNKLRE